MKGLNVFFLLVFFLINPCLAQENLRSREEQQKYDEKQQKILDAQESGRKRHKSLQKRKVRKRMRASEKKARKVNENRKSFFLFRLFRRNR